MKAILAILVLTFSLNATAFAENEKISIRGIGLGQGKRDGTLLLSSGRAFPAVIDDAEQLAKVFKDEDLRRSILKQADLKKHTLLYFAWLGRTGDWLTARVEESKDGTICTFYTTQGVAKDIRYFYSLYALPKGSKWEVLPSPTSPRLILPQRPVKQQVRIFELQFDGDKFGGETGNVNEPVVINSSEQLAKVFKDEDTRRAILKQVNLEIHTLVYFAWSGSGRDSLKPRVEKGEDGLICTFTYKCGLTEDLRSHHQLFAISKDARWKVKPTDD